MVAYENIITEVFIFVKQRGGGTEKAGGQAAWGKAGTERRETDAEIRGGRIGKRAMGTGEENGQNNGTETEQQRTKRVIKVKGTGREAIAAAKRKNKKSDKRKNAAERPRPLTKTRGIWYNVGQKSDEAG